jgi:acyl homoserine lactone synthase
MLYLITAKHYDAFAAWLTDMHRLRYRVFKERLAWHVETTGDQEMDRFDDIGPAYLLYVDDTHRIRGCVRLVPTTGPYMLRDVFANLVTPESLPNDSKIWESSRFAVDLVDLGTDDRLGLGSPAQLLFVGMIEFGLAAGLDKIATVTDTRVERLLRRANWPLFRLGAAQKIGATEAVAGLLDISAEALERVRERAGIRHPILWKPALESEA